MRDASRLNIDGVAIRIVTAASAVPPAIAGEVELRNTFEAGDDYIRRRHRRVAGRIVDSTRCIRMRRVWRHRC